MLTFGWPKDKETAGQLKMLTNITHKREIPYYNEVFKNDASSLSTATGAVIGDRFIPNRESLVNLDRSVKFLQLSDNEDICTMNMTTDYWRKRKVAAALNYMLGIKNRRILELDNKYECMRHTEPLNKITVKRLLGDTDWPCCPRSQPTAVPYATHDMPHFNGYNGYFDNYYMDWSINDQIALSLGPDLIIWDIRDDISNIFNIEELRCLRYSPCGSYLAIGCMRKDRPALQIWKMWRNDAFIVAADKVFNKSLIEISVLEWSKNNETIVCGTETGAILILSRRNLRVLHKLHQLKLPIESLKFSSHMRYLAAADTKGVFIYNWFSLEIVSRVNSQTKFAVSIDWHPWNDVDLVIAESEPCSIKIFNVTSRKVVACYQRNETNVKLDSVNFSKLTGELLVTIYKRGLDGQFTNSILVLSSLSRVVDILDIPGWGVQFMMFSADGTKIATAGNDNSMSIWKFCSKNQCKKSKSNNNCPKIAETNSFQKWAHIR